MLFGMTENLVYDVAIVSKVESMEWREDDTSVEWLRAFLWRNFYEFVSL
jgi:hypothetical protein